MFVDTDFQKVVQQVRPNAPNVKLWITLYETPGVSTEGLLSNKDLIAEGKNEFPLDANFGTMFYTGGTTGTSMPPGRPGAPGRSSLTRPPRRA